MFSLEKHKDVINFLKNFTKKEVKKTKNEYIFFCPFCDDIEKKSHGHLYLAIDKPVFYCFRCNISGNIKKLLHLLEYKGDIPEVDFYDIKSFSKNKIKRKIEDHNSTDKLYDVLSRKVFYFKREFPMKFESFKEYIYNRIGRIDFLKFLISPGNVNNKLVVEFYNLNGQLVTVRYIDKESSIRYKKYESSGYFFQNKCFKEIIISEGCFDAVNLKLYSGMNGFFYAILSNNYVKSVEDLTLLYPILIGKFKISIVFDSDVQNIEKKIFFIKRLASIYELAVDFNFYIPLKRKDFSEYPELLKI